MGNTHQTIEIDAPLENVWAKISDFHNMDWASGVIASCLSIDKIGSREVGAKRLLNGAIHETLLELDSEQHIMRYSIDDGPSPIASNEVSNYIGVITLTPSTGSGQTSVEWTSSWQGNEVAATKFCSGVYNALLAALKTSFAVAAAG